MDNSTAFVSLFMISIHPNARTSCLSNLPITISRPSFCSFTRHRSWTIKMGNINFTNAKPFYMILNYFPNSSEEKNLDTLMSDLRNAILNLKTEFIAEDGLSVDYKAMSKSLIFEDYKKLASKLQFFNISTLQSFDENERKAFFINLYNVQMIHSLLAQKSLPDSPTQVERMWGALAYNVGGLLFTLDEIEHGILRCNRGHPRDNIPMFKEGDKRCSLVMSTLDPRIHFALNCGAKSCPPIRIYQGATLDEQLDLAARSFINQDLEIDDNNRVVLSKLLLWYKNDFGNNDAQVLEKLFKFVIDEKLQDQLQSIIKDGRNEKIKFRDYDWKLNSK